MFQTLGLGEKRYPCILHERDQNLFINYQYATKRSYAIIVHHNKPTIYVLKGNPFLEKTL